MMIDKRLIGTVPESRKYIAANVALQWCGLVANVAMMMSIASLLASLLTAPASSARLLTTAAVAAAAVLIRWLCTTGAARMSDLSSRTVKKTLRTQIYEKLLRLGASYSEHVSTAEVVQVAVEGVDQLETYFGAYLPQFFYAMLAPVTLFAVLCFVNVPAAVVLLVCVPLIPAAIAAVQTWAKKLLSRYWGQYTKLGDTFLENLQGLTTLKIYQADGLRNDVMNEEAEKFRKITMKVLTMQLNSITIMDLIAYGGAALGVIMAATQLRAGKIDLAGALLIILLAGLILLLLPGGSRTKAEPTAAQPIDTQMQTIQTEEQRLAQLLRQISGAGQVQVLLSYSCSAERELATDDSGQPAIISAGGGAQAAVELRTVSPQYLGAVVVCDGADAPQVQLAVTQAVAQFTGLSTDRISVLKKQPDA